MYNSLFHLSVKFVILFLVLIFFLLGVTQNSQAQWVQTNGPYGGRVLSFAASGTNLFAATAPSGVFLSTNNGKSWSQVNSGLTNTLVLSLAVNGTNLFAGTDFGGIFLSTNNGTNWTQANPGPMKVSVNCLASYETNLFAGQEILPSVLRTP